MSTARAVYAALSIALLGLGSVASAQSVRLDGYRMAETPEDGFAVSRPDDLGHLRFGARLDLDYALDPLVYQVRGSNPATESAAVVEHLLAAQLGLSFGLFDRLVISAGLPVQLVMDGALVDGQPRADGASLGDVWLSARGRLYGEADDPFAIALQVTGTAPTAHAARAESRFAGDGGFTIQPELVMEVRFARVVRITGNVGALVRETQDFGALRVGHELTWALGVYAWLVPEVLEVAVESWGSTAFERFGASQVSPIEAIGGLRVRPIEGLQVGVAAGAGLQRGYGAGDFRAVLSVGYASAPPPGPSDRDADGANDTEDRCPDEPEDRDGRQDDDGCPDLDDDGDGIDDASDECPAQAEDRDGLDDEDGCPEQDADGDGATDETDRCPTEPGIALAARAECTGCPTCPDPAAPTEPTATPAPEAQTLPERVYFDVGAATLRRRERAVLETAREYLAAHPELPVQVEGHADFRGSEPNNVQLSRERALLVAGWLLRHGIDRARITVVACGEAHPDRPNDTRAGRRANRRVELHVGPAPVRSGCTATR